MLNEFQIVIFVPKGFESLSCPASKPFNCSTIEVMVPE